MRTSKLGAVIVVSTLLLSACSGISKRSDDPYSKVDRAVARDSYTVALRHLDRLADRKQPPTGLKARRTAIERAAQEYEQHTVSESRKLAKNGEWQAALEMLHSAREKNPDRAVLTKALDEITAKRDRQRSQLELERLLSTTRAIRDELRISRELAQIKPANPLEALRLHNLARQLNDQAALLGQQALDAYRLGDRALAQPAIELAIEIRATAALQQALTTIEQDLATQRAAKNRAAETRQLARSKSEAAARQQQLTRHLASTRTALSAGRLLAARAELAIARRYDPTAPALIQLEQELDRNVTAAVVELLDRAHDRYRSNEFLNAKSMWERVLKLRPGHPQARANLDRVTRVLDRLDELENSQLSSPLN